MPTEREIEDALIEWLPSRNIEVLGRQVQLYIGRADVLGWWKNENRGKGHAYLFEVKMGRAPESIVPQLHGYCRAVENIIMMNGPDAQFTPPEDSVGKVQGCVVAEGVREMTQRCINDGVFDYIRYEVIDNQIEFCWASPRPRYMEEWEDIEDAAVEKVINYTRQQYMKSIQVRNK